MVENKCCKVGGCGELNDETHPSSIMMMRIFGVLAVIFSVAEFGLGGAASGFLVNPEAYVGSWWVGLLSIAIGICGIITKNRGGVITIIVLGSIAMLIAVAGAILDSYRLSYFSSLITCVKVEGWSSDYDISGATDDTSSSAIDVACSRSFSDYTLPKDRCLCTSSSNAGCQSFQPNSKYTCDDIMLTLPSVLKSSIAICSVIAFCSIVLAAVGCSIVCCNGTAKKEKATDPEVQPDNIVVGDIVGVNSNSKAY